MPSFLFGSSFYQHWQDETGGAGKVETQKFCKIWNLIKNANARKINGEMNWKTVNWG